MSKYLPESETGKELSIYDRRAYTGNFYEGLFRHITGAKILKRSSSYDLLHYGTSLAQEVKGMGHSNSFLLKEKQVEENLVNFSPRSNTLATDGIYGLCSYKSRESTGLRRSLLVGCKDKFEVYQRLAANTDSIYVVGIGVIDMIRKKNPIVERGLPQQCLPGFGSILDNGNKVSAIRVSRRYLDELVNRYSLSSKKGSDRIFTYRDNYVFLYLDEFIVNCYISVLAIDEQKMEVYKKVLAHQAQPGKF